eukprot:7317287-Prymnesium_polylepis.1
MAYRRCTDGGRCKARRLANVDSRGLERCSRGPWLGRGRPGGSVRAPSRLCRHRGRRWSAARVGCAGC